MSRIKKSVLTIVCVLLLVVLVFFGGSVYALRKVLLVDTEKTKSNGESFLKKNGISTEQILRGLREKKKKVFLKSRYGHVIPVEYMISDKGYDNLTVVLVHGHSMSLESMYPIAKTLLDNNINVVLYDQRSHGENTAGVVTFGYYEKDDLMDVIDYVKKKMKKKNAIGLLGQSMGAATVGFYSGTDHAKKNVDFVILDCPYNNMRSIIRNTAIRQGYKKLGIDLLIKISSIANEKYLKFSFDDVDIAKAIENSDIPTLIYEAKFDRTCPYYMADEVFDGIKHNNKEKVMLEKSEHIKGFYIEREKYVDTLLSFINKYGRD
ncbi:MAG: alpha/beta hydrolase [Clostridiales bacterium]|nr:alpha/beta hydrolase [Clostridiales bacterium]